MIDTLLWTLILIQILMGAFDTLVHHEMTERLAWRPSQAGELRLHSVRNFIYALVFLAIGLTEPRGFFAWLLLFFLVVEVCITLWDFVEEDRTRALPPSERVNHTLLALNYGAILVLAAPVILGWAGRDTAIVPVFYGFWSWMCAGAALAVALFGLRDWAAARRWNWLVAPDPAPLAAALGARQSVLVTGGTGFIGSHLVSALVAAGHDVTVVTRDPKKAAVLATPLTIVTGLDRIADTARFDSIVHLAGESIAGGLWSASRKERIIRSRVDMLADLRALVGRLAVKPRVLVAASATGWYGDTGSEPVDESHPGTPCFTHESCRVVERSAMAFEADRLRVVCLRIGLVLGVEGGLLARMLAPFEFGLGGPFGNGRQMMSWIARDDLIRLIVHALATRALAGPVNAVAPRPVTNNEFCQVLGHTLRRPVVFSIPAAPLRWLLGDFAEELLLRGQNVVPQKASASGFTFYHRTLADALAEITGNAPKKASADRIGKRPDRARKSQVA